MNRWKACGQLDTLVAGALDLDGAESIQDTLYVAEIQVLDVQDDGDTLSTFSEIQGTASTVDSLIALTVELVEANDARDSVSANVTPIPTAPLRRPRFKRCNCTPRCLASLRTPKSH